MSDLVEIIRAIARDEIKAVRLGDLGVVTGSFPKSDAADANNYECNVKLREGDLELRKVPIATPHIGMVSAPREGDLVFVSYVGGDPARPVVVGRFYSDQANPPLHDENEWRVEAPFQGETSIAIDKEQSFVVTAGKTALTLKKDGSVEVAGEEDLKIVVKGNVRIECADCMIDASGNIELGADGGAVITDKSHKCFFSGAPLVGSATVKAKG